MKRTIILTALLLGACGMDSYRPQLAKEPKDHAKYEADIRECIQYSKNLRTRPDFGKSATVGSFGLLGYAALEATKDDNDPYFKSGPEITDQCMKEKSYKLAD